MGLARRSIPGCSAQELELAVLLVRALAGPFDPAKFKDHFQENLRALIDARIQGNEMEERASKPSLAPVDILEALKASLARKKQPHAEERAASAGGANRKIRSRVIG